MGSEKDINNNILDDDALESVAGGMEEVNNLVYSDKTKKKLAKTIDKNTKKTRTNLVHVEKKSKTVDKSLFSGDVIDKGTYC
ncbi:hypothetical protein D6855_10260 [Butyrivibrio sp. CB08]|uniref:hypothetical protein n=1 Tax=Butyrivibrio sp. CB08 TaxID=2364879 RepID=UPI000EAA16EB|nr:hypothetical protein [Butyrivibrio sp. CB08]RKM59278.1 hypothetical protein D6855_10260 [Butyrivibrio sp. CB08]